MKTIEKKVDVKSTDVKDLESFEALLINESQIVATEQGVECPVVFRLAQGFSGRDWEQFVSWALEGYTFELKVVPPVKGKE